MAPPVASLGTSPRKPGKAAANATLQAALRPFASLSPGHGAASKPSLSPGKNPDKPYLQHLKSNEKHLQIAQSRTSFATKRFSKNNNKSPRTKKKKASAFQMQYNNNISKRKNLDNYDISLMMDDSAYLGKNSSQQRVGQVDRNRGALLQSPSKTLLDVLDKDVLEEEFEGVGDAQRQGGADASKEQADGQQLEQIRLPAIGAERSQLAVIEEDPSKSSLSQE